MSKHTGRRWKLAAYKSGDVVIVRRASDCPSGALIFFSTDTKAQAEGLVTYHCRLSREDNETMFLNRGAFADVDELREVAERFAETYAQRHPSTVEAK